jgi:hypothetical protein
VSCHASWLGNRIGVEAGRFLVINGKTHGSADHPASALCTAP